MTQQQPSAVIPPEYWLPSAFASEVNRSDAWQKLQAAANGDVAAKAALVQHLASSPRKSLALIELAIHHAGSGGARARCDAHLADPHWSVCLPLKLQEYSAPFPADPLFEDHLPIALEQSGWGGARVDVLRASEGVEASQSLVQELDGIAEEAALLLGKLEVIRSRVKRPPFILQIQALTRAEEIIGSISGRRVLEVGPQHGGLFFEMIRLGADVTGIDLGPQVQDPRILQGDFLFADLPGPFDLLIATAVFERGSSTKGEPDADARNNSHEVLKRFHQLLVPGGLVVLENIQFPIPFSKRDAEQAGFEVLIQRVPSVNCPLGGRGCTLRRAQR